MDYWQAIDGLSPRHFELLKVLFEKGALALVVGIGGLVGGFLIERFKTALTREVEVTKLFLPRIAALLDNAEELLANGLATIDVLATEYRAYDQWGRNLAEATTYFAADFPMFPNNSRFKDLIVINADGISITIQEHVARMASTTGLRKLIYSDDFWNRPEIYLSGTGLASAINAACVNKIPEGANLDFRPVMAQAVATLFASTNSNAKAAYLAGLTDFRKNIMKTLGTRTRKQKKIFSKISFVVDSLQEAMVNYPKRDAVRIEGFTSINTPDFLILGHGALVTLLRRAVHAG